MKEKTPAEPRQQPLAADNPIQSAQEDVLGRAAAACSFAEDVLSINSSRGLVVGVLGPWGSGKTSFVNLVREHLSRRGVEIVDFNPWMFSGAEQLVTSFFIELSAQLKTRKGFEDVGAKIEKYGEIFSGLGWLPVVGPWLERARTAAKIVGGILKQRKEGVGQRRIEVETALQKLKKPLIVVLDDIDRLTTAEIRDVFKLVRLTASFPNVVYLLAFDRTRVEAALEEHGIPGRDYLEKILQLAIDLPAVPGEVLDREVFAALDRALEGIEPAGGFDEAAWTDIYFEVVQPLVRSLRDVRRYALAVRGAARALSGRVALVDVLALEAVRVFLPAVFARLHPSVGALTTPRDRSPGGADGESPEKKEIDTILQAAGDRKNIVTALVQRLFPAAQRHVGGMHYGGDWLQSWQREHRVAHPDFLRLYLERAVGSSLEAFVLAEQAWERMADEEALAQYFRTLPLERWEDVVTALESFRDQYGDIHTVPASTVLLNLLPEMPDRPRGMFDFGAEMAVSRHVYRLLSLLQEPTAVEAAVRAILPGLHALSSKLDVIMMVGHREDRGHKLVSEEVAGELEHAWREEVRAATVAELASEKRLLEVLMHAKLDAEPEEPPLPIPMSSDFTYALLNSARTETRSQGSGTRAVRRTPRLYWKQLVDLYGDELALRERVEELVRLSEEKPDDLVRLALDYLEGSGPKSPRGD